MKEEYNIIQIFLATIIGVLLMIIFTITVVKPVQYKKGQVDAMNGEIKYELVTQPDSTRTWESIKIKTINNGKTKRNDN